MGTLFLILNDLALTHLRGDDVAVGHMYVAFDLGCPTVVDVWILLELQGVLVTETWVVDHEDGRPYGSLTF